MRQCPSNRGFTLVELLVVIGIIALLISILLPSLNAARRQANAVKCATQLRDLGNAFRFYSIDNRGYYPACLINGNDPVASPYTFDGDVYPKLLPGGTRTYGIYWFNFINKYVTKTKLGVQTGGTQNSLDARRSIIWGCNAFDGYNTTGLGTNADVNPVQPGYGMNPQPYFSPDGGSSTPSALDSPATVASIANGNGFIKANVWGRQSALRCLLMDSALYQTNVNKPIGNHLGLFAGDQNVTVDDGTTDTATAASLWRHGKLPSTGDKLSNRSNKCWYPIGNNGKLGWNILYCDGHVNLESDPQLAYSTVRMKFPG